MGVKKNVGPEKKKILCLERKNLGSENCFGSALGQKNLWVQKILVKKNLGPEKFWVKKDMV